MMSTNRRFSNYSNQFPQSWMQCRPAPLEQQWSSLCSLKLLNCFLCHWQAEIFILSALVQTWEYVQHNYSTLNETKGFISARSKESCSERADGLTAVLLLAAQYWIRGFKLLSLTPTRGSQLARPLSCILIKQNSECYEEPISDVTSSSLSCKIKRVQAVGKWDKGLHQALHMASLNTHLQFQVEWATHRGEKWMQTDGRTAKWSFLHFTVELQN